MTIQEAITRATNLQTGLGIKLMFPTRPKIRWYRPDEILNMELPVQTMMSCEWRVKPRVVTIREELFRESLIPVLRNYLDGHVIDQILNKIQDQLYENSNFIKED